MASSPELMGEAQRFAEGSKDAVAPSMFLVQIPFMGGNEFLHLTSFELQLLRQSQLIKQEDWIVEKATPELLSELNPMQLSTTDNNNVKEMFATLGVALPETGPLAQTTLDQLGSPSTEVNPLNLQGFSTDSPVRPAGAQGLADLSIDPMMNPASTRPTPAPMNTAADSTDPLGALINPRTGAPMTLLPPERSGPEALPERTGITSLTDVLDRPVTELFNRNTDAQNRVSDARRRGEVAVDTPSFMDSDAGQSITPEMAQELKVLEQARGAQEFAGGFGGAAKAAGAGLLEGANIAGGVLGSGTAGIGARVADVLGYTAGYFPSVSKPLFRASDSLDEFKKNYYGNLVDQDNFFPRMYTRETQLSDAERLAQVTDAEREAIASQSDAAIKNADPSVFAEGEPVLPLDPDNLPDFARTISNIPPEAMVEGPYSPRGAGEFNNPRFMDVNVTGLNRGSRPPPRDGFVPATPVGYINQFRRSEARPSSVNLSPQSLSDDMAPAEELMALRAQEAAVAADRRISGPETEVKAPEEKILSDERKAAFKAEDDRTGAAAQEQNQIDAATGTDTSVVTSDDSLDFSPMEKTIGNILEPISDFVLGDKRTEFLKNEFKKERRNKIAADSTIRMSEQGPNFVPPSAVVDAAEVETDKVETDKVETDKVDAAKVETDTSSNQSSIYEGYKKEIQDVLGKGNKTIAGKEKWEDFSLAMFRIAAGKDPDAVTNIAAGLAQAAVDKKTSRSVQQDRDDKINLLALKMAGDERIANIRASGTTSSFSTPDRMYAKVFENALSGFKFAVEMDQMTQDEATNQARRIANEQFPNASSAGVAVSSTPTGDNPPVQLTTTQVIKNLKDAGASNAEIKQKLIGAGKSPAMFGY